MTAYGDTCPLALRQVCHSAVSEQRVLGEDVIFTAGEMPVSAQMHIVFSGSFLYRHLCRSDEEFLKESDPPKIEYTLTLTAFFSKDVRRSIK